MPDFSHLHVHTQYSLLDGATHIEDLVAKVKKDGMKAVAISDHGNMFGAFKFVSEAKKAGIIPVVGCEFYIARDRLDRKDSRRYHQLLLAKNETGYKNLSRLCSLGFAEGFYHKPRIDKELLRRYREGLIATTCCIQGEVPRTILDKGEEEGEAVFREWLELFGEDYYIELQRHGLKEQDKVNAVLVSWAQRYHVKVIATNDSHYLDRNDAEAHDILLCLQTGKDRNDPNRMRFSSDNFYVKTRDEMAQLFKDIPEALDNTSEIIGKIEPPRLERDILLPNFILPEGFKNDHEYLRHLAMEGACRRYPGFSDRELQRLEYELDMIKQMGYAGYFLIVQDFIRAARELGVTVGPGRGSVAGSAVAYAIGITDVDPIRYNLFFERFLNPERVSMPDIDIDFDDEGRQKVIDYVVEKYGRNQVAHIVTFGTMAAKLAIRDVARVLGVPLFEADRLAKMVPDGVNITFEKAYALAPDLVQMRDKGQELIRKTLKMAEVLEGSVRHTALHAAGIIIAPSDLLDCIPVCKSPDSDLLVSQFDGKYIESAGILKMDFLGLRTLSIIRDAIQDIKRRHGTEISVETIPLDDPKTFELYQRGDTVGTFQFESEGMRAYLKELRPTTIEDLIAMNALFRPGPMSYIPEFIERKHGKKKIEYPHPLLRDILSNTYGIMVYQEQIMQTAQAMGGFTLGAADILRRAMGKKKMDEMLKQKDLFIRGAAERSIDRKTAEEVFTMMEKFAEYGFNRSHSAAYSILAFHTAYLKANYPAEYMAAVLTHNMNNIDKISYYLDACRSMDLKVLGPDINESYSRFTVNKNGEIRFGLAAIKGVGEAAMGEITRERDANGPFKSIFDITRRVNSRVVNKRCLESLALAGAFDSLGNIFRSQYFAKSSDGDNTVIEQALRIGNAYQSGKHVAQNALFDTTEMMADFKEPGIPAADPWPVKEMLMKEKEITGLYITGHPLDSYRLEIDTFCNMPLSKVEDAMNRDVAVAGVVSKVKQGMDKYGKRYVTFSLEDYTGSARIALFSEDCLRWQHFAVDGEVLFVKGRMQSRNERPDFRVKSVMLLSEVREKEAKEVVISVPLGHINDALIQRLENALGACPGSCGVRMQVVDPSENLSVPLESRKYKVSLTGELITSLEKIPEISCRLG